MREDIEENDDNEDGWDFPDIELWDNEPYEFTCVNCKDRGNWGLRQFAYSRKTSHGTDIPDFLPFRCARCNRQQCKYMNSKRRMFRLSQYCWERRGQHAKMITIGLVSSWDDTRTKFEQLEELRQKWTRLRKYMVENQYVTGGTYVTEVTQKVTFDGTVTYWDRDMQAYAVHDVGFADPYGLVKFHAHVHAVVDMASYRGAALAAFSELGYKFGLGRISVTYAKRGDSGWATVHTQAKYLAKYISKDVDCGRQATFGKFIGFRLPEERIWLETKLDVTEAEASNLRN